MKEFIESFNIVQQEAHQASKDKGWRDQPRNDGEIIALIHSELSEALDELRQPEINWESVSIELADAVIRIMDFAESKDLNLAEAIIKKMKINRARPQRNGGKRF